MIPHLTTPPRRESRRVDDGPRANHAIVPFEVRVFMRRAVVARERYTRGLYRSCGYDLRATRERCPECGARINLSAP